MTLSLTLFPVACTGPGDTISGASSGFVSSPNFPGNFLPSKTCVWIITVPSGRIKLSFLNFTLEPGVDTECSGDGVARSPYIKFTNAASDNDNNPYFQLCGQKIPAPVYSVGNTIQIELISASNVYSGFNASYETITDDMRKFLLFTMCMGMVEHFNNRDKFFKLNIRLR